MKHTCHIGLADFLTRNCIFDLSRFNNRAFRIGCVEPDYNPLTYIKGSVRAERLRGHNFMSSKHYMERLARRLEQPHFRGPFYFYSLGKLVHYITDAFTFVHNDNFGGSIAEHNRYEADLESHFLDFLSGRRGASEENREGGVSAFQILENQHSEYMASPSGPQTDSNYALNTASMVVSHILSRAFSKAVPAPAGA